MSPIDGPTSHARDRGRQRVGIGVGDTPPSLHAIGASFRPIVHLATGATVGWEAIARLDDPRRGPRLGGDVARIAADVGTSVHQVELTVLARALAALSAATSTVTASRPSVTVRLGLATILRERTRDDVAAALDATGVNGARLFVELVEEVTPDRCAEVTAGLERLRRLGVRVALGEIACIGTFGRLRSLPFDRLHLGACSAEDIHRAAEQSIVRSLVGLARDHGADVMASGVDSDRQARALRRLGCPLATGAAVGSATLTPVAAPTEPMHRAAAAAGRRRGHPVPADEVTRLGTLYDTALLDGPRDAVFDAIATDAATLCEAPIALVTLVDVDRVWFVATHGFDGSREVDRAASFCTYAICDPTPTVVPDMLADERFHDHPLVIDGPGLRSYAAAPIVATDGTTLGTVCVMDHRPRELGEVHVTRLTLLARHASSHVELRARLQQIDRLQQEADTAVRALDVLRGAVGTSPLVDAR